MSDTKSETSKKLKVLLTTSGIGSRLGNLTEFTNKSLVVVGNKPAISHIIDSYPADTEFVITLGYFAEHIREYLELAYEGRNFTFVEVNPYQGPGSSLAFSIYAAKDSLQAPFIYQACDSIIPNTKIPSPSKNWVAGNKGKDATNYSTFDANKETVETFHEKGMTEFDYLHIGLVGINSYKAFWERLDEILAEDSSDSQLNDVTVISALIKEGFEFGVVEVPDWIDIGNSSSLQEAKKILKNSAIVLEKANESIAFVGDSVIKFFADSKVVEQRVARAHHLGSTVPKVQGHTKHFYKYEFLPGDLAADSLDPNLILRLLEWAENSLWVTPEEKNNDFFQRNCEEFYIQKSEKRISEFLRTRNIKDTPIKINSFNVAPAKELLDQAKPVLLDSCVETGFHGDFILDNILVTPKGFKLIDWRQNFGESLEFGDIYYDFAKLNHGLTINHDLVRDEKYFVQDEDHEIKCGILRKDVHVNMQKLLKTYVTRSGLDWNKVEALTALVWLNMAPLHHHPFDKFLYYYGRLNLAKSLNGNH